MPETTAPAPIKPRSPSVWTPELARINAAKSVASRRRAIAEREAAKLNPPPEPPLIVAPDEFVSRTLSRVRKQITRLIDMLSAEMDAAKADRLAAAIGRLSEIERQLADRPLPGSRRPAPEKPRSRSQGLLED